MSGYHYSPYRNERITDYYESLYAHKYNWDETDNSLKETNRQDSEETDKQCYWKIVKKKKRDLISCPHHFAGSFYQIFKEETNSRQSLPAIRILRNSILWGYHKIIKRENKISHQYTLWTKAWKSSPKC